MTVWLSGFIALPSAIWLMGLLRWRAQSNARKDLVSDASVAAVVVARNEEATIAACIRALAQQDLGLKEIAVFDDYSSDGTLDVAKSVASEYSNVQIIQVDGRVSRVSPKKHALATAFKMFSSERIALTDADCVVPGTWVRRMTNEFDDETGAVIGASWPNDMRTFRDRINRCERLIANSLMASACGWGSPASACGHSIIYRKEALDHVGAPVRRDFSSGDDDLTVQAIAQAGWKVRFCSSPESVVTDMGGLRGSRWSQAARHQSVTHLYPMHWRVLFIATILANVIGIGLLIALPFVNQYVVLLFAMVGKTLLDAICGMLLARKLQLDITSAEIFLASFLLPFWTVWRAVAGLFGRKFEWRGRQMNASPVSN